MTIASPQYADPLQTDPELLAYLRDCVQDIDRSEGPARVAHLNRLEWFVREQIAAGIVAGVAAETQKLGMVTPA